jgi:hypothetical protein
MPITIDGAGTISGLSTGGLPNGSVVQADIATNVAGTGPAFSAYASAGTSLGADAYTKITLAVEDFDTNNNFASSRFTPTVAGYYSFHGSVGASGAYVQAALYKNGSRIVSGTYYNAGTSQTSHVSGLFYMNGSTDYVELYAYAGVAVTSASGASSVFLHGFLARAV